MVNGAPVWNDQDLGWALHILTRTLELVLIELGLHMLAYNLKQVLAILKPGQLLAAIGAAGPFYDGLGKGSESPFSSVYYVPSDKPGCAP